MPMTLTDDVRRSTERVSPRTRRLCAAVAVLVVVAAVPTFFVEGVLNGTPVMNGSARGTALTMFALALPVLAVGLVTSTRGSVWGRAGVIGGLGYLTYNATLLVYATPFNELFLAYVALLGLSLWSLVSALLEPRPLLASDSRLPARHRRVHPDRGRAQRVGLATVRRTRSG
jgi:peptidoglycan/LPS O-acetylase OafA/YrhL